MTVDSQTLSIEALAEALETMAFLTVLPLGGLPDAPEDLVRVTMTFTGPMNGTLELMAGKALGVELAANVMGTDPDDEETLAQGYDALKELLNVTCGALLPKLANLKETVFDITVPNLEMLEGEDGWNDFVLREGVGKADVEENPVAIQTTFNP